MRERKRMEKGRGRKKGREEGDRARERAVLRMTSRTLA